ncbi:hypothetical protein [Chromobacterium violaceum]|uniref:hypothetical protein n=1 Tax=Chromobacterium violaceum TaxID=536 RepID=UPI0011C0488A|nr:hypothetical protein [Chromobacterium violaceum]
MHMPPAKDKIFTILKTTYAVATLGMLDFEIDSPIDLKTSSETPIPPGKAGITEDKLEASVIVEIRVKSVGLIKF